jgi:hypothetical protein
MEQTAMDEGLASLRARARVATGGLYLFIAFSVARAGIILADSIGLIDLKALPSQTYLNAFYFVVYGSVVVFYGTAIAVAFWIYRAHKNLAEAQHKRLEFTPGWSVGWFFVPVANLYMPYKAMREAWDVSLVGSGEDTTHAPPLLVLWWSSYLAGNIADWLTLVGASFEIVSRIAMIIAAWALGAIIRRISAAQNVAVRLSETFA